MKKQLVILAILFLFIVQTVSAHHSNPTYGYYGSSYAAPQYVDYPSYRERGLFIEPDSISFDELRDLRRNRYGYLDARDLALFYDFADDDAFDKFNREYYEDLENVLDDFYYITLDQYNELANADLFDRYDSVDLDNLDYDIIDRDFLRRLNLEDYNTVARANPYDRYKPIDKHFPLADLDWEDMTCWDLDDYNTMANLKSFDRWDVIDFTDFDDLDLLTKVGRGRVDFFDPDDFDDFDLDQTILYGIGRGRGIYLPFYSDIRDGSLVRADLSPFFGGSGGFQGSNSIYIPGYYNNGLGLSETSFNPNFRNDFVYLQEYDPFGERTYLRDYTTNSLDYTSRYGFSQPRYDPSGRFKYGSGFRRPLPA